MVACRVEASIAKIRIRLDAISEVRLNVGNMGKRYGTTEGCEIQYEVNGNGSKVV